MGGRPHWSVGQVVDGSSGYLIPTSITFTLYDVTTRTTVFSGGQAKGGGNANHKMQATMTCKNTRSSTAGDVFGPYLPPGVSAGDAVTFTVIVGAVPKV